MSEKFFKRLAPGTIRQMAKHLNINLRNKSDDDIFEMVVLHYMEDESKFWQAFNLKTLSAISQEAGLPLVGGEEPETIVLMLKNLISAQAADGDEDEEGFNPTELTEEEEFEDELEHKLDSAIGLVGQETENPKDKEPPAEKPKVENKEVKAKPEPIPVQKAVEPPKKEKKAEGGKQNKTMSLKANLRKLSGRSQEGKAIKDKVKKVLEDIAKEVEGKVDEFTEGYHYETYELRVPGSKIRFFFLANKHNEAPVDLLSFSVLERGDKIGETGKHVIDTLEGFNDGEVKGWFEERINYYAEEGLKILE